MVGHGHGHGHAVPFEVVGTMIEMADMAWNALEHRRENKTISDEEMEILELRSDNDRMREVLTENLEILRKLSQISSFSKDCPSDLYERLEAAVDSSNFLTKLESRHQESEAIPISSHPSSIAAELKGIDLPVNIDGNPSWWIWVTKDMVPEKLEEASGIDNDNYIIINDDNVVDGIAEFIAKCIHENPKSKALTPEQLQRTVAKALGGVKDKSKLRRVWEAGKIIYALSTWGVALAGLYRGRAVLKAAAIGVHAASKVVVKAL